MNAECFLDTNILVYAATRDSSEKHKRKKAIGLIEQEDFGLSAQVLQEFHVVVTRKLKVTLSAAQSLEWIEQLSQFPCVDIDSDIVKIAIEISSRHQISYWDGAIIAAAELLCANTLYSEDLNHGQKYGSVEVLNPFI